jgi:hypothetical protein
VSEARRTAAFGGVALALLVVTWVTAPRVGTPGVYAERGTVLFPEFRDPNAAASLEITEFDARNATVLPFKVQNHDGRWTIPSQHDYPADARDRFAQTAAALIALKKDDVATDNAADFERYGVLDPVETTLPAVNGRGTRVVVRGTRDQVLADIILGKPVEGHPGFRYVRQPGQKRVYVSSVGDLNVSTAFADWIERDLLQVAGDDIDAVNLRNYSLDRGTGRVNPGETLLLEQAKNGEWTINGLGANEVLDLRAVDDLLRNLGTLRIAGVLPKPPGITATLSHDVGSTTVTPEDRADLARKGFYLASTGQLVSDRGEVVVRTTRGVFYTLRFGNLAPEGGENRYLFIMADFDPQSVKTPAQAPEGAQAVQALRARFAPWYYVIAADSFARIRAQRSDLVKTKAQAPAPKNQ